MTPQDFAKGARQYRDDPSFHFIAQGLQALVEREQKTLQNGDDLTTLFRAQGRLQALQELRRILQASSPAE